MLLILNNFLHPTSWIKIVGVPESCLYFPISEGDGVKGLIALASWCLVPFRRPSSLPRFVASKLRTEESLLAAVRCN